jgi:hypothetical protein
MDRPPIPVDTFQPLVGPKKRILYQGKVFAKGPAMSALNQTVVPFPALKPGVISAEQSNIVDLDGRRAERFLLTSLDIFLKNPPSNEFERGFLAALTAVYRQGLRRGEGDARLIAASRLVGVV